MKYILTLLLLIVISFGAYYFVDKKNTTTDTTIIRENQDSVISYISKNISALSPEKESLGGNFYVTNITLGAGVGTVSYEDGHNAYNASFIYSYSEKGEVQIKDFVLTE